MSKVHLREMIRAVSDEKDISRDLVIEALEAAFVSATKKCYGADKDFRVTIDPETGDYTTVRIWTVSDPLELADQNIYWEESKHLTLDKAKEKKADAQLGDVFESPVDNIDFGRIGVQTAKQVIMQRLRAARRQKIVQDYAQQVGELLSGTAKKVTRDYVIVELANNAEGVLKRSEMIPREIVRVGDRVRAYLQAAEVDQKHPQLVLSRTAPDMLTALFKIEVPEIADGLIEVKAAARDPGSRAKLAVQAKDNRIDPVGACVGMRGARVQAVSQELGGERVDIVLWHDNIAQFVINALAPAEVKSIVVDNEDNSMDVIVADDQLSIAIGRNGQNVRLASQLSGWTLNVISETEAQEKEDKEAQELLELFEKTLKVEESVAIDLVEAGFSAVDEIADVDLSELLELAALNQDETKAAALQATAKALVEAKAAALQKVSDGLLALEGMTETIATALSEKNILTEDDLAECSVDDLLDIEGMTEKSAGQLIMKARAHWFDGE